MMDLAAFIDCGEFKRSFHKIYLPELELKKPTKSWFLVGSFLDLMIPTKNKKIVQSCLIRGTAFPFSIVHMPFLNSNATSKFFYSAFEAEILKSARKINDSTIFQWKSKIFISQMTKQGSEINRLSTTLMDIKKVG